MDPQTSKLSNCLQSLVAVTNSCVCPLIGDKSWLKVDERARISAVMYRKDICFDYNTGGLHPLTVYCSHILLGYLECFKTMQVLVSAARNLLSV